MNTHLAGVIPVAGQALDFNMPWHDALMPIGPDYLMVERSVLECAYAGCNTIWIVCNDDVQPLIRHRIGEVVQDPVYVNRNYEKRRKEHKRPIRIYYVPINPRDVNKRDCLSWSVIHGAETAKKISSSLSTWLTPQKFYVSWPYGYYDPSILRQERDTLRSSADLYLSTKNGGVEEGFYSGFSFSLDYLEQLKEQVYLKSTGLRSQENNGEKLPLKERFSYRFFSLKDVFDGLDFKKHKVRVLENYFSLDSWQSYCEFLSQNQDVQRPHKIIFSYKEWNEIGFDEE